MSSDDVIEGRRRGRGQQTTNGGVEVSGLCQDVVSVVHRVAPADQGHADPRTVRHSSGKGCGMQGPPQRDAALLLRAVRNVRLRAVRFPRTQGPRGLFRFGSFGSEPRNFRQPPGGLQDEDRRSQGPARSDQQMRRRSQASGGSNPGIGHGVDNVHQAEGAGTGGPTKRSSRRTVAGISRAEGHDCRESEKHGNDV